MEAQRGVGITSRDGVIFGLFHPPDSGTTSDTAVLMCPPFGWEDMCSYRSRRAWAQSLAASGHPVLRIDLPATGESSGSPRDGGQLGAWTAAVGDAADWLRAQSGAERVAVIGIGLGGLVAAHAVGTGADIDELVLWAVNARGKRLLRELRAFASLNSDVDPDAPEPDRTDLALPPPQPDGSLAVGGFLIGAETVAELEELDIGADPFDDVEGRRALLLGRDAIAPDKRLGDRLEGAGMTVSTAAGDGYSAMMDHPQLAQPPLAEFGDVAAWLAEAHVLAAHAPSHFAASAPDESFELVHDGTTIRETPIAFGLESGDLYGVLSQCDDAPKTGLTAVLLNAGALRRVGPGRLWVELSRNWATRGIATLRLDLEGLGDADGGVCPYADTADLYVPKLVDQTIAALDQLADRGLPPNFILSGLCSGAYWSFHAALRDPRVESALMLNPRALYYDTRLDEVRDARKARNVATPGAWKRILTGDIAPSRAATILRAAATAPFYARADAKAHAQRREQVDAALAQLDAAGKRVLFLFGENEPLYDEMVADGQAAMVEGAPSMRIEHLPGRDHSFRPISAQRHVRAVLDRAIDEELSLPR